jgi:AcrR family transcriptional regulator
MNPIQCIAVENTGAVGRPRDASIDEAVLRAAREQLAASGYDAMSVVAVAEAAGTTRQALYRRWPSKADLATAAIASLSTAEGRPETDDPFADLVAELTAFRDGVSRPNGIGMVGSMLQDATDPELVALYRRRIVAPRRARLRRILERAVEQGLAADDADIDYAVAACTGLYYSLHLAGARIARDWPERTARLVWASIEGADRP